MCGYFFTKLGGNAMIKNSKKSLGAFSLIELLVVMAVLAVLLSLLQISLRGVLKKTYRVQCTQNLKMQNAALAVYLGDFDDRFPLMGPQNPPPHTQYMSRISYEESMMEYSGWALKILECPGFDRANYYPSVAGRSPIRRYQGSSFVNVPVNVDRGYLPNCFRYYNSAASPDPQRREQYGLLKYNYHYSVQQVQPDTIFTGDYVFSESYIQPTDRRGVAFANHENEGNNLSYVDGSAGWVDLWEFFSNDSEFRLASNVQPWYSVDWGVQTNNLFYGTSNAHLEPVGSRWNWGR